MSETNETETDKETAGEETAGAEGPQWPLFYKQPVPLSIERHGGKSINLQRRFGFASDTNMVPVNMQEFSRVATSYPIVFTETAPASSIAILGLRQSQNLFVNDEGTWDGGVYVPAYVRRYPFIFSTGQEEEQLVLCVDEADELIVDGTGEENTQAIYDGEEASEVVKKMLEFCAAFHRQSLATREFVDELENRDLFRPGTVTISNESGEQFNLRGFRIVDEEKFNALPDDAFLEFRRKGWLQAVTAHLISIQNLAALGFRSKSAE
ncbi:MAG: SapC family protein [Rhodospirillaceae bacterium]|nr:SapC family protein [Rhodospirillaceae bacterium]